MHVNTLFLVCFFVCAAQGMQKDMILKRDIIKIWRHQTGIDIYLYGDKVLRLTKKAEVILGVLEERPQPSEILYIKTISPEEAFSYWKNAESLKKE